MTAAIKLSTNERIARAMDARMATAEGKDFAEYIDELRGD